MSESMFDTAFDTDEYLHLAIHASSARNPHACMSYLKKLLEREPNHAKAIYLLAVQHAELGLHERAIAGMQSALVLEPTLEMARFQLGLLLLDRHRFGEAKACFEALDDSTDAALRGCCGAMLALIEGDVFGTQEKLRLAASQRTSNSGLPPLIRHLLEGLAKRAQTASTATQGGSISLGAYGEALKSER